MVRPPLGTTRTDTRLPYATIFRSRIRGMLDGVVRTLLDTVSEPGATDAEPLARALIDCPALLSHLHALAVEWRIAEQLQVRLALDPVDRKRTRLNSSH